MSIDHPAYRNAQVFTEPFFWAGDIADGELVILGPHGDVDPEFVLVDVVVYNAGDEDVYVATTLHGAAYDGAPRRLTVPAGESRPVPGEVDTLCLLGFGDCTLDVTATRTPRRNSGKAAGHPGHGEMVIRVPVAADTVTDIEIPIRYGLTLTHVYLYSKTATVDSPPSGSCTVDVLADETSLLDGAPDIVAFGAGFNEGDLTGTIADRTRPKGSSIVVRLTSTQPSLTVTGDLAVGLTYELTQ